MNPDVYYTDTMFGTTGRGMLNRPFWKDGGDEDASVDVVFIGFPLDLCTTGRSGSRMGPEAIRAASKHLRWEQNRYPHKSNVFHRLKVVDGGDVPMDPGDTAANVKMIRDCAFSVLELGLGARKIVAFGGDHFVTHPLLQATSEALATKVALLHFDAHTDTYHDPSNPDALDHGTMFHPTRIKDFVHLDHVIQVGIRTEYEYDLHPYHVVNSDQVHERGIRVVIDDIRERIPKDMPVYVTVDIDVLDPSCAPGTGTPVCGGLFSHQLLGILRGLKGMKIVGADIVEVAPSYDHSEITSLAAATCAYEILYLL